MTDAIYQDEAIIRSVSYSTRGGHKVSFEMDPEGWERLKGMETQRCMMVLVPIQNDGTPDIDATPKPEKPKRRMSELSRAQQAGILCNDPQFQQFIGTVYDVSWPITHDRQVIAAGFVRNFCKVKSRAELDSTHWSGTTFDQLRSEYDAWAGRTARPE